MDKSDLLEYSRGTMIMHRISIILVLALTFVFSFAAENEFIRCYANSALESQRNGKIICPRSAQYCVKETTNATRRSECGVGKHSTDVWDRKVGQCVYRKCSDRCTTFEEDKLRHFNVIDTNGMSRTYNRTSFCCDSNLCNAASNSFSFSFVMAAVVFSVMIVMAA